MTDNFFSDGCPLCRESESRPVAAYPEVAFVACRGCRLVYKSRQVADLGPGYDAAYFEDGPARYLKRFAHRVAKGRRQLLAALELVPGATDTLDVGSSAGYMMQAATGLGLRGQGIDLSPYAVKMCQQRGLRAQVGTVEQIPHPDNSFDIVTAKHVLEHSAQPQAMVAEICRVLRPGGVALVIVPDAAYWKRYLLPQRGSYFSPRGAGWQHHIYYATDHLAAMAQAGGLAPAVAGKAIYRRRLAGGWRRLPEVLRFACVWLGSRLAAMTHTRREIQLLALCPSQAVSEDRQKRAPAGQA